MNAGKEILKNKIIDFQRTIAALRKELQEKEELSRRKENEFLTELIELTDVFDNLEETLKTRESSFDRTAKSLVRNFRSIHRKLQRILADHQLEPITFKDRKALPDTCVVVDTRKEPTLENEVILEVLKGGYLSKNDGKVFRKAEVITVKND